MKRAPFHRIDGKRDNALNNLNTIQEKKFCLDNKHLREEDYRSSDEEFSEHDFMDIQDSPSETEPQNIINNNNRKMNEIQSFKQMNSLEIFQTIGSSIQLANLKATHDKETRSWDQEFERIHIFTRYYANNNADIVLKNYDKFIVKKAAEIQKLKNMKKRKNIMGRMPSFSPMKSFCIMKNSGSFRLKHEMSEERSISLQESPKFLPDGTVFWDLENRKK